MDVFDNAMVAMEEAGVELVPINMTEVLPTCDYQLDRKAFQDILMVAAHTY